jgi:hypothetical protein
MDIVNHPIFILNYVSENGLCLRPQIKSLLIWAKSIELVLISGQQNKHKAGYVILKVDRQYPIIEFIVPIYFL